MVISLRFLAASLATMLLALTPGDALALRVMDGPATVIAAGRVIDDDILITGQEVTVDGTVTGDLIAFAEQVRVRGRVEGDLLAAAREIEVTGTVGGDARLAGQRLDIRGTVGHNLMTASQDATLAPGAKVNGSWLGGGSSLTIDGSVGRGLTAGGERVSIAGQIGQGATLYVDRLTISSATTIDGPVQYTSNTPARIDPGARIAGPVTQKHPAQAPDLPKARPGWFDLLRFIGFAVTGLIFLALFPAVRERFPEVLRRRPWQSLLLGFGVLVGVPVAAILLMVTIGGLPLGLAVLLAFPLLIYLSQAPLALAVGRWLGERLPVARKWPWPATFLLGVAVTTILTRIPVIGGWLAFLAICLSLGITAYLLSGRGSPQAPLP